MLSLLDAAQMDRVIRRILDMKSQHLLIEGARPRQVGNTERDVARAHNVEGRIDGVLWSEHASYLLRDRGPLFGHALARPVARGSRPQEIKHRGFRQHRL